MNFIAQSTTINASSPFKESTICCLHWSWFSALRICPLHSKKSYLFASYRWSSAWTLPNCIVYSVKAPLTTSRTLFRFSQYSHFTLWLWKSVSLVLLGAKTLQWLAHFLSSSLHWLRCVVFKYNLLSWSLLRASLHQSFFCSHAFQFIYKPSAPSAAVLLDFAVISSVWPLELLVVTTSGIYLSVEIHSLCNGPCIDKWWCTWQLCAPC